MNTEPELIEVNKFCISHSADISFIYALQDAGLLQITTIEQVTYIPSSQLYQLEKLARFYYDLDINLEGIEAIAHLLQQIEYLQENNRILHNRLKFYEQQEIVTER
jgi:chaperone modulatory protein CbpM